MTTTTKKKMSAKSKAMWQRIKELQAEGYTLKEARAIWSGKSFPIETAVVSSQQLKPRQKIFTTEIEDISDMLGAALTFLDACARNVELAHLALDAAIGFRHEFKKIEKRCGIEVEEECEK